MQEMTLEEYEKVLSEKRKALEALKSKERKVTLDKDSEAMQLVERKNEEEVFAKLVRACKWELIWILNGGSYSPFPGVTVCPPTITTSAASTASAPSTATPPASTEVLPSISRFQEFIDAQRL